MTDETPQAEDLESRWPRVGDSLFLETAWASDAHVARDPAERFYRLPIGYKRAGDILIHQAAVDVVDRRNIIYPALFCYRQSIELFLKALIEAFGTDKSLSRREAHNLRRLWERFMCIVDDYGAADSIGLCAAQRLIAEMHDADEHSDGFRYPTDRGGTGFALRRSRH